MDDAGHAGHGEERLGSVLRGKYRLDSVLGYGGMAVVYAATHRNQKRFAVKVLHPELCAREEMRNRFVREGYVANTVQHPGAVAVLDDDVAEDGAAFLVMELLEGRSVEAVWEASGRQLSPGLVLAIAHQLLDVLAAAHAKSIVHRDVKPANVFLTRSGAVKVLDFGIARIKGTAQAQTATSAGAMLGTPAFMSPEQALAEQSEIDARTDLWGVGATMFLLLSGRAVHEGSNAQQTVILTATRPAPSLAALAPQLDARVVGVVDRALAFAKAERWGSAQRMRAEIERVHLESYGASVGPGVLASLMTAMDANASTIDETLPSGHEGRTLSTARTESAPSSPASMPPPAGASIAGKTTASLVSGILPSPRKRGVLAPIVAVVCAVVLCCGALLLWRSQSGPARGGPGATAPEAAAARSVETAMASPSASAPRGATAASAIPAPAAPLGSPPEAEPPASVSAAGSAPSPRAMPTRRAPSRREPAGPARAAPSAAPTAFDPGAVR